MGWVFTRPSLTALEVAWRWICGAPLLAVCWVQAQHILARAVEINTKKEGGP